HVVELIVVDRPEERDAAGDDEQQGDRNQDEQDGHAAPCSSAGDGTACPRRPGETRRPMRMAFSTTSSELKDMPRAAAHGGTKPNAASGTAARLYASAQRWFWRRMTSVRRARSSAPGKVASVSPASTMSLLAWARSAPLAIATATSAPASTGAS